MSFSPYFIIKVIFLNINSKILKDNFFGNYIFIRCLRIYFIFDINIYVHFYYIDIYFTFLQMSFIA